MAKIRFSIAGAAISSSKTGFSFDFAICFRMTDGPEAIVYIGIARYLSRIKFLGEASYIDSDNATPR
jgi:hypothetical protein